ncbi:hypothetical protein [Geothermobacter hydrogeniphilus]|uniref:Uncharacterized protein n=1 Tax=Geothermobacter hydrogeniphilus TaxID=1969733 RepID=A0A1X0YCE1_9BACT|nr:hypothetical protein [Geothermobacter hydrogeniphilus]ORJ62848.1 hypothetical protein B5V00_01965 [Geothermobacter hydrogeniphilus]
MSTGFDALFSVLLFVLLMVFMRPLLRYLEKAHPEEAPADGELSSSVVEQSGNLQDNLPEG